MNSAEYLVRYNDTMVNVAVHIDSSTFPKGWSDWYPILQGSVDLRPKMPVVFYDLSTNVIARLVDNKDTIAFKTTTGANVTQSFYASVTYARK